MTQDERWMRRALELAARGLGETNPNPAVGCVIVKRGRVVGEGWHRRAGGPHAEVLALDRAGRRAVGGTLYVTLEPCAHHGRTPPCAPRLAAAGIARVVAALRDPNPAVNGRGLRILRRAGVTVVSGVLAAEAALLNEPFIVSTRKRRPFVRLKAATTLDGRIATARGESKWITSPEQRRAARRLRRLHDAVLVGIGTVLSDDPLLLPSPRLARPFHRVVLDSRLRLPAVSRLVRTARAWPVVVLTRSASRARAARLTVRGVQVLRVAGHGSRLGLRPALRALWRLGVRSLMVEGGSEVLGSFLGERLFDQVVLFRAPLLLGGRDALPAFGGRDPSWLSGAVRLGRVPRGLRGAEIRWPAPLLAAIRGAEVWYPQD
jgi:diaminohydroxyphosphoribosylaminopyrimidine deaminase/5-amino-6-(5-phosphoribosylamino)uracil reductase